MKILNKLFPGYKSEKHAFLLKNVQGRTILVIYCLLFLGICFSVIFSNMSEVNYRKTWNDVSNKGAYEKALVEIQKNASTSTFNEKEKSIIAYGKAYNYTREEVENSIIRY